MKQKTLLQTLIDGGISKVDAATLAGAFADQPEFDNGMDQVVNLLAVDQINELFAPEGEPWASIWEVLANDMDNKEAAFNTAIAAYPDDIREALGRTVATKVNIKKAWYANMKTTGKMRTTAEYMAILKHLGYRFKYNKCTLSIEVNGQDMHDFTAAEIRARLRDSGIREVEVVEDAYRAESFRNKYHPIQRYLESLKFEGGDPIGELASYFTDEKGVFGLWIKRWLVGAVARAFGGHQNRVLILDGPQGIGKSHFVHWLGSPMLEYFYEGPILPDDKDCRIRRLWVWIWEVNEFGTVVRRADREALKAFLTTREIQERKVYDRYPTKGRVLSSYIGTANNEIGLLNDPTGSRRFMVAHLTGIDWAYAELDIDQVWAQAMNLYLAGEPWDLSPQEVALSNEINDTYQVVDQVEETIKTLFAIEPHNTNLWMSSLDIMEALKNAGNLRAGIEVDMRKMASALTKLGLTSPKVKRVGGQLMRGYFGIRRLP